MRGISVGVAAVAVVVAPEQRDREIKGTQRSRAMDKGTQDKLSGRKHAKNRGVLQTEKNREGMKPLLTNVRMHKLKALLVALFIMQT